MKEFEFNTPIIYIMFNRPYCVRESFESIRRIKPKQLFIAADGPRKDHPDDIALCKECRKIVENIDWDCEVHRDYSDINMGCGMRPASGISAAFEVYDRAIILEDDCIPNMSFFRFCQELLEKYREDERIYSIDGINHGISCDDSADYCFGHINLTLGWATWKRVWEQFDYEMNGYEKWKERDALIDIFQVPAFADYWYGCFDQVFSGKLKSAWDYQFTFLSFRNNGLHIYPRKSMIRYIGFDENATHPVAEDKSWALFDVNDTYDISFPMMDPVNIKADRDIDYRIMKDLFRVNPRGDDIISNSVMSEICKKKNDHQLIIYGAGNYCRKLLRKFNEQEIDEFKIAVTDTKGKDIYVLGNKVNNISELVSMNDKALVLIAVAEKNREDIVNNLNNLGFKNYLTVF